VAAAGGFFLATMIVCNDPVDVYHWQFQCFSLFAAAWVLPYKYSTEANCRGRRQLLLDASKVLFGAGWCQVIDFALLRPILSGGCVCGWYVLESLMYIAMGMPVCYYLMSGTASLVRDHVGDRKALEITSGWSFDSGGRFVVLAYAKQLVVWLLAVSSAKVFVAVVVLVENFQLGFIARDVFGVLLAVPFLNFLAMLAAGLASQGAQLWIADSVLVWAREVAPPGTKDEALLEGDAQETGMACPAAASDLLEQIEEAKELLQQLRAEQRTHRRELEIARDTADVDEEALRAAREELEEIHRNTSFANSEQ